MENFSYYNPTRIVFGKGREKEVGALVSEYGKKVLLLYGGGSIVKTGLYDTVTASLKEKGIDYVELPGVKPNPRLSLVREGIRICREEKVEMVLAVGGGSVIDSAKAIASGVLYDGDLWEIFINKGSFEKALPIGVILTIPASGSEGSPDCVLTNEDGMFKRGLTSKTFFPKFSIINPELHYTLPPYQTACGCCDIMAHMMERYFTPSTEVDVTDRLIEAGMRTILHYAPIVMEDPKNYNARAQISWIGTFCHNTLFDAGRISDFGSHNIEHELSATYDIAHGAGLAMIFPAFMKYTYKRHMDRFYQFATRVMDVDYGADEKEKTILEGIYRLEQFYKRLNLPTRMREVGIDNTQFEMMSKRAMMYRKHVGSFEKLYEEDIRSIYELAY